MSVSSVDEFARAHLPADLARELAGLVGRLISEARVASSLATLVDPRGETLLPAVDLEPNDNGGGRPHTPGTARFEDLGLLGQGAMGEVRRVRDRDLNRVMAMKVIRAGLMELKARFVPVTEATYWSDSLGIPPREAILVAVNHRRTQILAQHHEIETDEPSADEDGDGDAAGEPEPDAS